MDSEEFDLSEYADALERFTLNNYWAFMAKDYISFPIFIEMTDKKYGKGASEFIGITLKACLDRQPL